MRPGIKDNIKLMHAIAEMTEMRYQSAAACFERFSIGLRNYKHSLKRTKYASG